MLLDNQSPQGLILLHHHGYSNEMAPCVHDLSDYPPFAEEGIPFCLLLQIYYFSCFSVFLDVHETETEARSSSPFLFPLPPTGTHPSFPSLPVCW